MIVKKNRHLEAGIAILGNKTNAMALLRVLELRSQESFQFITNNTGNIRSALLLLHNPGATTTFLCTPPTQEKDVKRVSRLISNGVEILQHTTSNLLQTIMQEENTLLCSAYTQAGFDVLATLAYMELSKKDSLARVESKKERASHIPHLSLVSMEHANEECLQVILNKTYSGSLDCPNIHGLRSIEEILSGHRGQGEYDPQLWSIAEVEGKPAGVLLLQAVPESEYMELSYLGCTPHFRGKGLGSALMQIAIAQSVTYGLPRIRLAVDSQNSPAISLYSRWGFRQTHNRMTMIRTACKKLSTDC